MKHMYDPAVAEMRNVPPTPFAHRPLAAALTPRTVTHLSDLAALSFSRSSSSAAAFSSSFSSSSSRPSLSSGRRRQSLSQALTLAMSQVLLSTSLRFNPLLLSHPLTSLPLIPRSILSRFPVL